MIQTSFHIIKSTFHCGRKHELQATQQFFQYNFATWWDPAVKVAMCLFNWMSLLKGLILMVMIHWCKQTLMKTTIVYLFPISETMLVSIRVELRSTDRRVMSISLFYFSSCISFSNQLSQNNCDATSLTKFHGNRYIFYICHSWLCHHNSSYSLSGKKQVLILNNFQKKPEDSIVMSVRLGYSPKTMSL